MQQAELARLRREGHGIWYVTCVTEGYDEEFEIPVTGRFNIEFAKHWARLVVWKALRKKDPYLEWKHIIYKEHRREA